MKRKTAKVYTDGGTVGHNGRLGTVKEVGVGILIQSNLFVSERLEGKSNNEAEFKALIKAMELCLEEGVSHAIFHLDSQIVYNRALGKKPRKRKHQNERMDAFQEEVLKLKSKFDKVEFEWVPREQNTVADELSKKACNE